MRGFTAAVSHLLIPQKLISKEEDVDSNFMVPFFLSFGTVEIV